MVKPPVSAKQSEAVCTKGRSEASESFCSFACASPVRRVEAGGPQDALCALPIHESSTIEHHSIKHGAAVAHRKDAVADSKRRSRPSRPRSHAFISSGAGRDVLLLQHQPWQSASR